MDLVAERNDEEGNSEGETDLITIEGLGDHPTEVSMREMTEEEAMRRGQRRREKKKMIEGMTREAIREVMAEEATKVKARG